MINTRYTLIDWLRATAIILMIIYHFMWDLVAVGLMSRDLFLSFEIRLVGRTCLILFLFCVGYSLALSHQNGIQWNQFFKRWSKLLIASAVISLLTYFIYPNKWVYFGILHHITVVSLLLLLFLKARLLALALGLYILLPYWLDAIGLCSVVPSVLYPWLNVCDYPKPFLFRATLDYIDLTPWGGASLLGVGASYFELHKKIQPPRVLWIEKLSSYSFEIYLIHQPVLMALSYLIAYSLLFLSSN